MTTTSKNARVAGFLYLLIAIVGPLRLIYIPTHLIVGGNATATVQNIAAHEWLFRLGMVGDLIGGTLLIFVTLALYRLFEPVNRAHAVLMVILGGILPAAIYFLNVANDAAALMLVRGADYMSVLDKPQRDVLAMLFLDLHYQVIVAAEVLWGLWLFPLAMLTIRSRFLPRWLGYWLILAGITYVVMSFTGELVPQYQDNVFKFGAPARLGEFVFMLWLVVMGAKERTANVPAA